MQNFMADFAMLLLGVISALLILVVLLQRGRGGGLAGAFGGLGGQSAFGTKAGDVFTKITIGLVTAWVLLAGVSGVLARKASEKGDFPTVIDGNADGSMSAVGDASTDAGTAEDKGTGDTGTTGAEDASSTKDSDADKPATTDSAAPETSTTDEPKAAATDSNSGAAAKPADESSPAKSEKAAETSTPDEKPATDNKE
ncbi:MAG: preprotein translocase subunit SecG [Rhodopirellula sp.]|nr:preprotein translocase subunit SecG [Rhodopirellula sp.]